MPKRHTLVQVQKFIDTLLSANGQAPAQTYCIQRAAQRWLLSRSVAVFHRPTAFWELSGKYYFLSTHLSILLKVILPHGRTFFKQRMMYCIHFSHLPGRLLPNEGKNTYRISGALSIKKVFHPYIKRRKTLLTRYHSDSCPKGHTLMQVQKFIDTLLSANGQAPAQLTVFSELLKDDLRIRSIAVFHHPTAFWKLFGSYFFFSMHLTIWLKVILPHGRIFFKHKVTYCMNISICRVVSYRADRYISQIPDVSLQNDEREAGPPLDCQI